MKYINASTIGYTLPTGLYKVSDFNSMLKSLIPAEVKVNNTIDDIRLKSNLITIKAIKFTERSFIHTIVSFTQSHSGPSGDIESFIQLITGK